MTRSYVVLLRLLSGLPAVLLLAGLTVSPPQQISVTVNPAVVASNICNSPAVPHGAQVAGFTTLAYCADFTTPVGAVNNVTQAGMVQSIDWSNLANWLEICGATGAQRQWTLNNFNATPDCSHFAIAYDAAAGSNVLQLTKFNGEAGNAPTMASGGPNCPEGDCFAAVPGNNMYTEIYFRHGANNYNGTNVAADFDWWAWMVGGENIEFDFIEANTTNPGHCSQYTGVHAWDGSTGSNPSNGIGGYTFNSPPCFDDANYHLVSTLATSNRTDTMGFCGYWDGQGATPCAFYGYPFTPGFYQENYLELSGSRGADLGGNNFAPVTGTSIVYVAWLRIWSCAGWNSNPSDPHTTTNSCYTASPFTGNPP